MKPLSDRVAEALDIAIASEGDIRLKEFLRAMSMRADPETGVPTSVSITCENRYWTRFLTPEAIEEIGALNVDELASTLAGWIQGAFRSGLLSISNPPQVVSCEW